MELPEVNKSAVTDYFFPHRYPFLSQLPLVFFKPRGFFFFIHWSVFFLYWGCKTTGHAVNTLLHCWSFDCGQPNQDTAGITTHGSRWSGTDECAKFCHRPLSPRFTQFISVKQELQERSNTEMAIDLISFNTHFMKSCRILYILGPVTGSLGCLCESYFTC